MEITLKRLQRYVLIYLYKGGRIVNIELTQVEAKRLISILEAQYEKSTEVYELSVIKKILQKLMVRIDDWIPDYTDL